MRKHGHKNHSILGLSALAMALVWTHASFAAAPYSVADLENLLARHSLTHLDKLLTLLPSDLLENFALGYETRGRQVGSPLAPRIFLFNADASLALAFHGVAPAEGDDAIEAISFAAPSAQFNFHVAGYHPDAKKVVLQSGPEVEAACTRCHSAPLRPNWDAFGLWPGLYGSELAPKIPGGRAVEQKLWAAFLSRAQSGRYRFLPGLQTTTLDALAERNGRITDAILRRNGARLGKLVAGTIKAHPAFRAPIFSALENDPGFAAHFPGEAAAMEKSRRETHALLIAAEEKKRARFFGALNIPTQPTENPDLSDEVRLAKIRYVFEKKLNIPVTHWSASAERNTFQWRTSTGSALEELAPACKRLLEQTGERHD